MAMNKCKECGGPVSSAERRCQHCGARVSSSEPVGLLQVACGVVIGLVLAAILLSWGFSYLPHG